MNINHNNAHHWYLLPTTYLPSLPLSSPLQIDNEITYTCGTSTFTCIHIARTHDPNMTRIADPDLDLDPWQVLKAYTSKQQPATEAGYLLHS